MQPIFERTPVYTHKNQRNKQTKIEEEKRLENEKRKLENELRLLVDNLDRNLTENINCAHNEGWHVLVPKETETKSKLYTAQLENVHIFTIEYVLYFCFAFVFVFVFVFVFLFEKIAKLRN